ncbi:MAG: hypothetical protein RIQ30_530, partial [Pseudomonadota bacterium]
MNAPINPPSLDSHNPLLSFGRGIAQFDAVRPDQIAPGFEHLLGVCETAVTLAVDAITPATWIDLVEPLEDAT